MKKILTFFAVLLLAVTAWAQNPKLTYQAVVRDNANMLVTNSTVDVTLSVLRTDNSLQYTQSFDNVPTNQNGLFTLFFGGESGWDNVNWIHSKIAVAITLPDLSVVKDTTEVNAVPLAISTINSGTSGPSTQVQSDWAQTDQYDPSFIQNKPDIGESVNTVLVNGQYVTITMMDGRHYLTSDSAVIVDMRNNISNNTTNIATNTANISNNTTNIATNTTNIAENTTNIATNTTNISNNTANISNNTTNIATNTTNIAENTTNIAENTTNIAENTTNIATNTTNISNNTTNISNNTANIETNTTNIAANTTNISNNTANIETNTTNIAANTTNINNLILHTKKAAIRDSVAGQIHDSIAAIGATITQNHTHTNMSVLSATTAPFTTANKATLDSLAAAGAEQNVQADWNETNAANDAFIRNKPSITDTVNTILANRNFVTNTIMDGRHYLTSDSIVIVNMRNNISNNTTNIISNTTNIEANTTNINNNTTKIETNITNIAANTTNISNNTTNISNNTTNIAANTTNIATNTTNISNNTTNIAANTTNISNNTTNIATNTTNISNNTTKINNNTANIATNTTNISNNTAHIATNTTNINNLILHTKKAAIRDSVAGQIHDSIAAIGATITQNHTHTNMSVLSATTAPFTTANKTTLDSLAAAGAEQNVQANWNETNAANDAFIRNKPSITDTVNTILANRNYVTNTVMDGRHYLTSDSVVIVNMRNNINNNTTNIINNTTNIEANTTNINNNTTNIAANTTNIATNTTNISNNTTNIAANTTNIATNTTNISNNTANIATNTTNIAANTTNISNNTANIAANTTNISNNTANIATNTTNINNLILRTKKAAIRDSVAGQIHDSIAANNLVTINNNQTISGDKTFTGTTIVPSGFTLGTTTASNCNNVAVNACDLLAVFDSIQRRMDNLESVIEDLHDEVANLRDTVRILRGDSVPTVTVTIPTVTTSSATNITETSATCGGNVTADGGADVTARGVCWGTGANPTIGGSHTTDGTGTGSFTSTITGLTAGTTYHVRAYATNSEGTAYGEEVSFTTQNTTPVTPADGQPCPGAATVTDHQGNVYNTVQIGDQCWTKENMRCTTSPTTRTTILETSPTRYSYTGKKAYYVDGNSSNTSTYGLLYNWNAAVDTFNTAFDETSTNTSSSNAVSVTFSGKRRGICPQGWHVPSDAEWTQLTTYVKSQPDYVCSGCSGTDDGNYTHCIAKALASTTGWNTYTGTSSDRDCYPGYSPSLNNATGFSAVPAGSYLGIYSHFGDRADFWSSTQDDSYFAYSRSLSYGSAYVRRYGSNKGYGFSVRCLRDEAGSSAASLPTVTTSSATNITETTATCGGNVTADGGADVTARGVCWSTNANPTIDGSHTTDGSGTGSFTSSITGLTANTTYHVRAYATNSEGTAYGADVSFTTDYHSMWSAQICDSETPYKWRGRDLYWPGTYYDSLISVSGCDSIYTLVLNISPTYYTVETDEISVLEAPYQWHGRDMMESGTYYDTLVTVMGCDSTFELHLTVNPISPGETQAHPCTVTYLRAGTALDGGKYANKEYGSGTRLDSVSDHQGNVYNTVQIGSQCWTKENMRCTTSPTTRTTILETSPTSYSYTGKKAYYVDGNSSNTSTYGLLYNWNAAVDTFNTAYGETSTNTSSSNAVSVTFSGKRRGICPQGWHVPSDAEWTQLTTYVKSQPDYVCSGCSGTDGSNYTHCIAKALASTTGWNTYTGTSSGKDCYPGYSPSLNNVTGFSAVPAGDYYGSYDGFGNNADFWSSTQVYSNSAYGRGLYYNYTYVYRDDTNKNNGFSVRCLRD